jgi:hypothetical protein
MAKYVPGAAFSQYLEEMRKNDEKVRALRAAQMIEKFASTLCYRPVKTTVQDNGPAPAWSTDASIGFTQEALSDLRTVEGILSFKGLAVHEVSHILFTPRVGSDIVQWVRNSHYEKAFNALEDQRIETLLVGRFGRSVVPWLTATIAKYMLANPEAHGANYALMRGRKYLPVEIRAAFRDLFVLPDLIGEVQEVVDGYRTMLFPADTEAAKDLIIRMDAILKALPTPPHGNCDNKMPDSYSSSPDSRPLKPRDQKRAQQAAQKRDQQEQDEDKAKPRKQPKPPKDAADKGDADKQQQGGEEGDEQEPQDGAGSDSGNSEGTDTEADENGAESGAGESDEEGDEEGDGADGDGDSDGEGDEGDSAQGDSAGAGNGGDDDGDAEGDGEGDAGDGNGQGQGGDTGQSSAQADGSGGSGQSDLGEGTDAAPTEQQVTDMLKSMIEDAASTLSDSLHRDLGEMNGDLDLRSNDAPAAKPRQVTLRIAEAATIRAARAFGRELERVKADNDPGWERVTNSGRISTSRYMRGAPLDEAFDRWQIGRDDVSDIEAVILLDSSGSMDHIMGKASDAMWGIKRSLDAINASCTVVTYDSGEPQMLYKADEKATASVKYANPSGGTNPKLAVKFATRVLAESSRTVKVLFSITDGEWGSSDDVDMQIRTLRQSGVLTAFALVGGSGETNPHNHEVFARLDNASDLLILGRQVVNMASARQLAR